MKRQNPVAKALHNPRFKLRVIADRTKKIFRKRKHKKNYRKDS